MKRVGATIVMLFAAIIVLTIECVQLERRVDRLALQLDTTNARMVLYRAGMESWRDVARKQHRLIETCIGDPDSVWALLECGRVR